MLIFWRTCKDNADKAFADCSIPQEKTNAEINAELDLSDASCDEDSSKLQPISKGNKPLKSAGMFVSITLWDT